MKKLLNLSCFLMIFIFQAKAELADNDPKFEVKVSKTSVLLGNYIEVTFILKNAGGQKFEAPTFDGFDIVSGPNLSSSFSMANGVTTQSTAYSFYIKPKDIGNLFVTPAFIEVEGKILETQPLEIMVLENPEGIIEEPERQSPNRMDMFDFPSIEDFFEMPKRDHQGKSKRGKKKRKIYKI